MQIAKDTVVSFHYSVATAEGELVDRSQEGQPMTYLHGQSQIIPGLEEALAGHGAGESITATIPPEKAYGSHDPELDLRVPMSAFPPEAQQHIAPGFRFEAQHPAKEEEKVVFTVHGVGAAATGDGQEVALSGNHPLAGQTLLFKVEVVEVRAATRDELAHGHAHGPGGHHHH
ncbi:MAG: peptidylprolyl isomerase [Planctomycetes bacterium]|nr:peptidylprolyl isomerase [Planctomycetota bacterium]